MLSRGITVLRLHGGGTYSKITSTMMLPLFFAITGFLSNQKTITFLELSKKVFIKLVIPWLSLSFIIISGVSIINGIDFLLCSFKAVLLGEEIWFMPCIIIAELLFYWLKKFSKRNEILLIISSACFALGYMLYQENILKVLSIDIALEAQLFLCFGFIIKSTINKHSIFYDYWWAWMIVWIGITIAVVLVVGDDIMDVRNSKYYYLPLCMPHIAISQIFIFSVANRYRWSFKPIVYIGKNTLVFYIWGGYIQGLVNHIFQFLGFRYITNGFFGIIIRVVCSCLILAICAECINRLCPILVGKRRNNHL